MRLSWYFQQKICFKVVVGSVKIGEAIVFLVDLYYCIVGNIDSGNFDRFDT